MLISALLMARSHVALRKESVDRNVDVSLNHKEVLVALRKESVDRNDKFQVAVHCDTLVALRKESVDRNADGVVSGSGDYGRSPQGERG